MKKIMFVLTLTALVSFAYATPTVNEKVLRSFTTIFPAVENTKWYEYPDHYEAYFDAGDVKCRVKFDTDGKILSTIRYYSEKQVSPFLKAKLMQKYPGKAIFGVTEVNNDNELTYNFVLEDSNCWTHVRSDAMGQMETTEKFKKG